MASQKKKSKKITKADKKKEKVREAAKLAIRLNKKALEELQRY